ncbi:hypothetical protein [Chitinophaga varians]|uniref:hypothetical protein n=1 Tax=Chitinophaga varians TaxID=2202339 RepID=UPI00165F0231|nr:hypothetical protein [Chitinophaga varians]MBC9909841.1 hypothetical protein [Chitinophaga varians]
MPVDKVLQVKAGTIERTFNLWKNDGRNNNYDYCILDEQTTVPAEEVATSLDAYQLSGNVDIKPSELVGVAYLVSKNLSKGSAYTIIKPDIVAIIVYYDIKDQMNVKVLTQENGMFKEIHELASETNVISFNHFSILASKYFNQGVKSISTVLFSDNKKQENRNNSIDKFRYKLSKYIQRQMLAKPTTGPIGGDDFYYVKHFKDNEMCEGPCLRGGSMSCERRPFLTCKSLKECVTGKMQPWNTYTVDNDPRNPTLYEFRDNFMIKSGLGQHFVEDYYYVSTVLQNSLNAQVAGESYAILDNEVIPIVSKLLTSPQSNDVLINTKSRANLIAYLDNVKTLSSDSMYLEIIDELKGNIQHAEGKTVKYVHDKVLATQ